MKMTSSRVPQSDVVPLDGWIKKGTHNYLLRVYYEDTDLGGIIYHANYLKFAERARSSYLRCLGIFQEDGIDGTDGNHGLVVRRAEVEFFKAASLGTILWVCSQITKLSRLRITLEQTIKNYETGHILAGVVVDIVYVSLDFKGKAVPTRMPSEMMGRLTKSRKKYEEK